MYLARQLVQALGQASVATPAARQEGRSPEPDSRPTGFHSTGTLCKSHEMSRSWHENIVKVRCPIQVSAPFLKYSK
jgi:hypothetical protein